MGPKCAGAHGKALLAEREVARVSVPALLECPPHGDDDPSNNCFYTQELPDMLRASTISGWTSSSPGTATSHGLASPQGKP